MPTYPTAVKIIKSSSLVQGKAYVQNIKFDQSNRTLVKGAIYDIDGNPLEGVGIEVILIDKSGTDPIEAVLGVVFSEINGIYAVSLEVQDDYEYLLNIYSGLPS